MNVSKIAKITLFSVSLSACEGQGLAPTPEEGNAPQELGAGTECGCDAGDPTERAVDADPLRRDEIEIGASPIRGPAEAPVTLVVFSDFQCPHCAKLSNTLDDLTELYPREVRVVFKHLTMPFHPHAEALALATIAAAEDGRFWAAHDALFADGRTLRPADAPEAFRALGIDYEALEAGRAAAPWRALLRADQEQARRLGVEGTPTTFVNGRRVVGAISPCIGR